MGTKLDNIITLDSCWNRAAPNETVFILRSTDYVAPDVVIFWANRYLMSKGGWESMTEKQRQKYHDALKVAADMRAFQETIIDDDIPF